MTDAEKRMAAKLFGVGDPPPASAGVTPDNLPEDEIERLQAMLTATERSLYSAIQSGKGRNATDLASTRSKLAAQLRDLEAERARADEDSSEDVARDQILAFLDALEPADPFLTEVRRVLGRKAMPKGTVCRDSLEAGRG